MSDRKEKKRKKNEVSEDAPARDIAEEEAPAEADIADVKTDLARERDEYLNLAKIKAAELENYKKRVVRERCDWERDAVACFAGTLLSALDNFERAFESGDPDDAFRDGVRLIADEIKTAFTAAGIKEMESDGKEFDSTFHEAVMVEMTEDAEPNTVLETFTKGYLLGDRVVRHAKVKVAKAPEPLTERESREDSKMQPDSQTQSGKRKP